MFFCCFRHEFLNDPSKNPWIRLCRRTWPSSVNELQELHNTCLSSRREARESILHGFIFYIPPNYQVNKTHEINIKFRCFWIFFIHTVDGWNPANQLICKISHHLQGFVHPRWLFGISEPSTVGLYLTYQMTWPTALLGRWTMAFHGFIAGTPRADQQAQGMEMLSDAKMKAVGWLQVYHRLQCCLNDIVWRFFFGFWAIYISLTFSFVCYSCWMIWQYDTVLFDLSRVVETVGIYDDWCINMISDVEIIEFEVGILQVAISFGQGVVRCVSRTDTSVGVRWSSGGRSFDGVPALSFAASASQETWANVGSHGKLCSNLTSSQFPQPTKNNKTNNKQGHRVGR